MTCCIVNSYLNMTAEGWEYPSMLEAEQFNNSSIIQSVIHSINHQSINHSCLLVTLACPPAVTEIVKLVNVMGGSTHSISLSETHVLVMHGIPLYITTWLSLEGPKL